MRPIVRICSLAVIAVSGCVSGADQHAMDGAHALDTCDLRTADTEFTAAHELEPTRSDIALAFALTDLGVLAEDPALTTLAPRFGFDRPIDSSLLWGHDGVLDRISLHASCTSVTDLLTARFPHPSLRADPRPSFVSTIDPTVTLGDARATLVQLSPRLHAIAGALVVAANDMSADGVVLHGGCGIGSTPTRIQAPELYALAAALEAIRAGTQAALAYDGAIPVRTLFSQSDDVDAWSAMANAHVLRVTDASQLPAARTMLAHAVDLSNQAIAAARVAHHTSDSVFDWTALSPIVLGDVDAFATASTTALATDGPVTLPRMTPALAFDVSSFFTHPIDFGAAGPLWTPMHDTMAGYSWVDFNSTSLDMLLVSRFDQDPFASTAPSRSFSVDWSTSRVPSAQWTDVFDPGGRWSSGYSCTSSTP